MRKITCFVVSLILCMSLTGCGVSYLNPLTWPKVIENATKKLQETSAGNSLRSAIATNSTYLQSKSTSDAGNKALDAASAAAAARDTASWWGGLPIVGGITGPIANIWADHKSTQASRASDNYYNAVAQDKVLQASIRRATGGTNANSFSLKKIPSALIVIVVLFILLFVWVLLRKKRKEVKLLKLRQKQIERDIKSAPQVVSEPVVVCENNTRDKLGTYDGQMQLLERKCAKKGVDCKALLEHFEGNPFTANEFLMGSSQEQVVALLESPKTDGESEQ